MNELLERNRTESAEAVRGLVKALNYFECLKDELERYMRTQPPRHSDDMLAIRLGRSLGHLRDAVGDLPNELLAQTFEPIAPETSSARRLAAEEVLARLTGKAVTA